LDAFVTIISEGYVKYLNFIHQPLENAAQRQNPTAKNNKHINITQQDA